MTLPSLVALHRQLLRAALGEERVRDDLRCLPPGCSIRRPEIWPVGGWLAGLAEAATRVAGHDVSRSQVLYEIIEGAARRHVLKNLRTRWPLISGSVGHDLSQLASGDVTVGAE